MGEAAPSPPTPFRAQVGSPRIPLPPPPRLRSWAQVYSSIPDPGPRGSAHPSPSPPLFLGQLHSLSSLLVLRGAPPSRAASSPSPGPYQGALGGAHGQDGPDEFALGAHRGGEGRRRVRGGSQVDARDPGSHLLGSAAGRGGRLSPGPQSPVLSPIPAPSLPWSAQPPGSSGLRADKSQKSCHWPRWLTAACGFSQRTKRQIWEGNRVYIKCQEMIEC